jgi:cyanophycin synthetase
LQSIDFRQHPFGFPNDETAIGAFYRRWAPGMKIVQIRSIPGPNVYHPRSVIIATIDLQHAAETNSVDVPGFIDRLLEVLPGLREHYCSPRRPGGFVERLHRGTYLAHIIEHVVIELSGGIGFPVNYGKSIYGGRPGIYQVVLRSNNDAGMSELVRIAVELVTALIEGADFELRARLRSAKEVAEHTALGPSTLAIVTAAEARGIPWFRIGDESLIQLGYGKHRRFIQASVTSRTSVIGVDIASDKQLTKNILRDFGIPVPDGHVAMSLDEAIDALVALGGPVVVKPLNANHGDGVTLRIRDAKKMRKAYELATKFSSQVLVERCFSGIDYRVLVVNGRFVAAAARIPAHVVGDGSRSIRQLVANENHSPLRGEGHAKALSYIELDEDCQQFLHRCGYDLDSVPGIGERVFLREAANLSKGGSARDVSDEVHPDVRRLCERVARILDLDVCGIDLITPDIRLPITQSDAGVIEVNAGPGLRMHCAPSDGRPRDVGRAIIDMLFPAGQGGRIPIISVTGTNGKTTVARMIASILAYQGLNVGLTTTDGIFIGNHPIVNGDTTGPQSARTVLGDPAAEIAVLETARGGIVRRGLGYDWSDVGVITNIQADHIGQDGIESIDDIADIKSLVFERTREDGWLVVNLDDPNVVGLLERPRVKSLRRRIAGFCLHPLGGEQLQAVGADGRVYFRRGDWIIEQEGERQVRMMKVNDIPATLTGTADFQVANCLAAVAAARSMEVSTPIIAAAMSDFDGFVHNSGRVNVYELPLGIVILDYGHNADAFQAICRMAAKWRAARIAGVIGVPGDRDDSLIEEAGRAVAMGFDKVIIRDDIDRRGREPGAAARILCRSIQQLAPDLECRVILDEYQAIQTALEEMVAGEVLIIFYDEQPERVIAMIEAIGGRPCAGSPALATSIAAAASAPDLQFHQRC